MSLRPIRLFSLFFFPFNSSKIYFFSGNKLINLHTIIIFCLIKEHVLSRLKNKFYRFILLDYIFIVNLNNCSLFIIFHITSAFFWYHCDYISHFAEIKNIVVVNFTNKTLSKLSPLVSAPGNSKH